MHFAKLGLFLLTLTCIYSCKEVLPDRILSRTIDSTYFNTTIPNAQPRKVLFEEYTGTSCVNCPDGHNVLKAIYNTYPTKMVIVGLHQGVLAEPVHEGNQDFRTNEAASLAASFGVSSLPSATIDRKKFGSDYAMSRSVWQLNFEQIKDQPVKLNLSAKTSYDAQLDSMVLELNIDILENISDDLNFTILLTENDIVSPQKNGSDVEENYNHTHVQRKFYTSYLGNSLKKETADGGIYKQGRGFYKKLVLSGLDAKWKQDKMDVVCFITNVQTKEVMQAVEVKFK